MWSVDKYGWLNRPARQGETTSGIDLTGCHAWVKNGKTYCLDKEQTDRINQGKTATPADDRYRTSAPSAA